MMMGVSLLTYAQYPMTKVIKGDTVVVMTLNQATNINNHFDTCEQNQKAFINLKAVHKDSISLKNNKIEGLSSSLKIAKEELRHEQALNRGMRRMVLGLAIGYMIMLLFAR